MYLNTLYNPFSALLVGDYLGRYQPSMLEICFSESHDHCGELNKFQECGLLFHLWEVEQHNCECIFINSGLVTIKNIESYQDCNPKVANSFTFHLLSHFSFFFFFNL